MIPSSSPAPSQSLASPRPLDSLAVADLRAEVDDYARDILDEANELARRGRYTTITPDLIAQARDNVQADIAARVRPTMRDRVVLFVQGALIYFGAAAIGIGGEGLWDNWVAGRYVEAVNVWIVGGVAAFFLAAALRPRR
jgi:hypothetical protein